MKINQVVGDARGILTFILILRAELIKSTDKQRQASHARSTLCYLAVSWLKIRDNAKCQFATSVPYSLSPRSLEFHRNIFNAIKNSKSELARKKMYEHLLDIEKEVYTILKQENITENVD